MVGKYKVITLCGSTRFKTEFMEAQKKLTLEGNIVISVGLFGHSGDSEVWENMDEGTLTATKEMLDDMHKCKIDMADEIFVINAGGYIGDSTRSEIRYAEMSGKPVRYLEPFYKLLSYNEAESIHTGFDAYREYFMSEKMVEKAKELACVQFAGCTDKAGADYFTGHLCSVAALVDTDEEKTVAFLHDILEDTDYPEEKLREEFGDEIVDAVCLLTHRERMDEAGYLEYISNLKASGNELAIAVKIADLTNNSDYTRFGVTCPEELQEKDRRRWEKYQKSQEILKGLK